MYLCEVCGDCTKPRIGCKKIVVKKFKFLHPERARAKKGQVLQRNGKLKMTWIPDPGGWGTQIGQEKKMCPQCAMKWERENKESANV